MASTKLQELASLFKAVAVIGPRQSGKTMLVKSLFNNLLYWMKLSGETQAELIYTGDLEMHRTDGIHIRGWRSLSGQWTMLKL
jgi:predicted AAA+ superfamily ATPase